MRATRTVLVVAVVVWSVVLLAPWSPPCDPTASVAGVWQPEGGLLGTDNLGRDVACRTLVGGWRLSLTALVAAALASGLGTVAGLVLGWFAEHRLAGALTGVADVALAVPTIVLALVAAVALSTPVAVVVATVISGAPLTLRIMMDLTAGCRASGYVRVARLRGDPTLSILLREVLPANLRAVTGDVAHRTVLALQLGAALHVLGFGPGPPSADWGTMMQENLTGLSLNPAAVVAPALALGTVAATVGVLAHLTADRAGAR